MPYLVQHVRFTLECDACGLTEQRDLDADKEAEGCSGWSEVRTHWRSYFCCPGCLRRVDAILNQRELDAQEAQKQTEAKCEHVYQQSGLLMRCAKCLRYRP